MNFDSLACSRNDTIFIAWKRNMEMYAPERLAAKLAGLHCNDETVVEAEKFSYGSYNQCFRVKLDRGSDVIVRFAALGRSFLRKEKIKDEVAVMKYIAAKHPSIPIPHVLGSGWCALGPYIVMDFVQGELMVECLKKSTTDYKQPTTLDPNIHSLTLKKAYREMARISLALFSYKFSRIGAIGLDELAGWSVTKRAVTFNMNELIRVANYPPQEFAMKSCSTASEYFVALADVHLCHLKTQTNDAIMDEADCRKKYIARYLFRKIAREFVSPYNKGPFRLFCDDFRPSNVMVDEDLNIQSVIDWEFCYAAPVEFSHCTPWWLLLARPDDWEAGLDDFLAQFTPRHRLFLEILKECEDEITGIYKVPSDPQKRLSHHMKESLETGLFWFCLAARSNYAFDEIYWPFIDEKYFGKFTSVEERLKLLSEKEQNNLDSFVQLKLKQKKEKGFTEHQTLDEIIES